VTFEIDDNYSIRFEMKNTSHSTNGKISLWSWKSLENSGEYFSRTLWPACDCWLFVLQRTVSVCLTRRRKILRRKTKYPRY